MFFFHFYIGWGARNCVNSSVFWSEKDGQLRGDGRLVLILKIAEEMRREFDKEGMEFSREFPFSDPTVLRESVGRKLNMFERRVSIVGRNGINMVPRSVTVVHARAQIS